MSECEPGCLHCLIMKQASDYEDNGHEQDEIAGDILWALCEYTFIHYPIEGKIDLTANKISDYIANYLRKMFMLEKEQIGIA